MKNINIDKEKYHKNIEKIKTKHIYYEVSKRNSINFILNRHLGVFSSQ
jgi:hypothetical protein